MKQYSALTLITALGGLRLAIPLRHKATKKQRQVCSRRRGGRPKNQDWNKAIEAFRKADRSRPQIRAEISPSSINSADSPLRTNRNFEDAIRDFSEALKINSRDARIYEQRAAVEMKMHDYDKALADYSEAITLKPNEVRYYLYRSYIYETKERRKNSMADTEKALKARS